MDTLRSLRASETQHCLKKREYKSGEHCCVLVVVEVSGSVIIITRECHQHHNPLIDC